MIKAVFFDIDGTLVSFTTHTISQSTRDALTKLRSKGIKIFVATGRSEMLIDNIDTSFFDGVISLNGQYCRGVDGVIHQQTIPREDIVRGLEYIKSSGISCLLEGAGFMYLNSINRNVTESITLLDLPLPAPTGFNNIPVDEIIQLIFFGNDSEEKELLKLMPSCEGTRWHPIMSDIIPRGGGKHVGMEKVITGYGIRREETMAFGDGENDMTMIDYAGIGIAMGNASDKVKAAADYVTDSVDNEGIAKALRHFGLIG